MADALSRENFGEAVGRPAVLPLTRAGAEVNVATRDLVVEPGIAGVREVVNGIVEVEVVVVHAIHEIPQVVYAGHREATLDDVGMLEKAVGGVVCAKRSAHCGDGNALRLAVVPDERDDLFTQVRIENGLDVAAVKWVRALVVKALALELPLVARAGRKTKERRAPVSEDNYA